MGSEYSALCSSYSELPPPAHTAASPSELERKTAIEAAKVEVQKEQATRRTKFALRRTDTPKAREASVELQDIPTGVPVLLYLTSSKSWEGPFSII